MNLLESARMHEPVLKNEVMDWLRPSAGQTVIDCTAGYGGHAEEILERVGSDGHLVGIDRDPDAIVASRERLKRFGPSVILVCDNYRNIAHIAARLKLERIDAILIDCGVSSPQIDRAERGFSFMADGPLDMRMDPTQGARLSDILRQSTEAELADTIFEYGQERYSRRIARAIKLAIKSGHLRGTKDLADAIRASVPPPYRRGPIHPATRTFQALRIRVNDELESLREAVKSGVRALSPGGRIAVISFHSLEDGIAKREFRAAAAEGLGVILTKKPLETSEEEADRNPRARSAKLRVFEKGAAS